MDKSIKNSNNQNKLRSSDPPFRVGFVLVDGFSLMSYTAAMEPLRAANLLAGKELYSIRHLPVEGARSVSSSGAIIGANAYLGEQVDFDLVLIVAGGTRLHETYPRLFSWIRLLDSRDVLIGAVSGGPYLLARAGVMTNRRMTVHWEHAQLLADVSPTLIVERSLYIRDRDRLTCAGGTAPLDMMLALIAEQHGPEFAQRIGDWFLHSDIRPGESSQRAGVAIRYNVNESALLISIEAMENHLADPLELSQLASIVGISARQLNRLFKDKMQVSTVQFYRQIRLAKARNLMSSSTLAIGDIASITGFANGAHLSRHFSKRYGLSPRDFRASLNQVAVLPE